MKKAIVIAVLASLCSGCAIVFQGPRGKACFPWFTHICHSLKDLD